MPKLIPAAMFLMLLVLVSGAISINFYHHLSLPIELSKSNFIERSHGVAFEVPPKFVTTTEIYLVDEIKSYKQMELVVAVLNGADEGDVVNLHLAGYGGNAEVVTRIINAMRTSKAEIVTIIESPVYSGHAYIALASNKLIFEPYAFIMMHTSSAFGFDCKEETGTNRAMTNEASCNLYIDNNLELVNRIIDNLHFMTVKQKELVKAGKDLYLQNKTGKRVVYNEADIILN